MQLTTTVAFLRAINVAGHATIRMQDLRRIFEEALGVSATTRNWNTVTKIVAMGDGRNRL